MGRWRGTRRLLAVSCFAVIYWATSLRAILWKFSWPSLPRLRVLIPTGTPQIDMRLPNGDTLTQTATRTQIIAPGQQAPPALFATNGGTIPQLPDAPDLALDAAYLVWIAPDLDLSPFARMRVKARIELPRATAFEQARFQFRRLFLRANRV